MRRPVVLLLYTAVFVGEAMWSAIVPLVPAFAHRFSLSPLQSGVLLASASVAILLVSAPAGIVGERLGARRVTLAAMGVLALADAGQGLAGTFWELLAARTLFGVGFGALWTTGIAWLSEATGDRQSRALSLTVTTAGLGAVAGPAFAGVLVQRFGLAAPFTIAAAVTVVLGAWLALDRSGSGRSAAPARATTRALARAMRERRVTASLALMGLGGLLGGAVNLLVPLQLHRNGVTTAAIGAAFAVSAVLFIGSSAVVAHLGDRAVRAGVGARWGRVTASLALMGLGGLLGGAVNLLVPLQLHRNGVTTAAIGAAFAVSAVLFIGSSAVVAHLGDRAVRAGVGAAATAMAAATLVIVLVSTQTAAVVAFLIIRGPVSAVIYTVTFPLGVRGGREAGIGVATMAALLNIVWALSTLVAPIVAGALAQTAGDRAAYGLVAVLCLAAAPWIAAARTAPAVEPASRSTSA